MPFDGMASWVWHGGVAEPRQPRRSPCRTAYFRRRFSVPESGCRLTVHASADSRYIPYPNGAPDSRGPAKGDIEHQFYDTVALDGLLVPGDNVLAAMVVSYAAS